MLKGLMCRIRASFMWYSNRQKPKSGNMHRKTFPPEQRVWELFSLNVQASETPILHPRKQAFQKPERASVSEKLPCSVGGMSAGPVTFADCSLERMLGRALLALTENSGSSSRTHVVTLDCHIWHHLPGPPQALHAYGVQTYVYAKHHTHKIIHGDFRK